MNLKKIQEYVQMVKERPYAGTDEGGFQLFESTSRSDGLVQTQMYDSFEPEEQNQLWLEFSEYEL